MMASLTLTAAATLFSISPFKLPLMSGADGAQFDTASYRKTVFVVEGFQLRCGPCNDNAPNIGDLASFYSYEDRVQVVDLGLDRAKSDYKQWIQRHDVKHDVVMDANRAVWGQLRGSGTPTTWVVDCNMNVKYEHVGTWDDDTKAKVHKVIDELLDGDCREE